MSGAGAKHALGLALLVTITLALTLGSSPAAAQQPSSLVERARAAAARGEWREARDLLRDALERSPEPAIAFNLALAHRQIGELGAAIALFERLLGGELGAVPADRAQRIRELLDATRRERGTLEIHVRGAPDAAVEIDGAPVGRASAREDDALRAEVDPGPRTVLVRAADGRSVETRVDVARGGVTPVRIEVGGGAASPREVARRGHPAPSSALTVARRPDDRHDSGGAVPAWVWIGGGVLVAAGAAIAITLAVTSNAEPDMPPEFLGRVDALSR